MIERWLQITCDGCGATETNDGPNETAKEFRGFMKRYGWRDSGRFDYCRECVKAGKHRTRQSMFETPSG